MANREIQFVELLKIAYACFVKNVVVTEEISLAYVSLPKAIQDRRSNTLGAIRNRVDNVFPLS